VRGIGDGLSCLNSECEISVNGRISRESLASADAEVRGIDI
jgi:hypothetical protein